MNQTKSKQTPGDSASNADRSPRRLNLRFVVLVAFILVVAGGIVGLSMAVPEKTVPARVAPIVATTIPNTAGIQNPRPYQYDPVTDRHWDPSPGHNHWHPGQPPANVGSTTPLPTTTTITKGTAGTPAIVNPQPWQYDPATNKHWDPRPGHNHWHNGPPPAEDQRG